MDVGNTILSRIFSRNVLNGLLVDDIDSFEIYNNAVNRTNIKFDETSTNGYVISEIYTYMKKMYRNEYVYKNALLSKLILSAHTTNTVALTEVPVAKSKADFIMLNGKAVVYEIKTELDNFERLNGQLSDYYKCFDHVCVVTSPEQAEYLIDKLEYSPVGLYVLTKRGAIKRIKEPARYADSLELECIFKLLNKNEYEHVIEKLGMNLPDTTPVRYYRACKDLFCRQCIDDIYPLFISELKGRSKIDNELYGSIPQSLKFVVYFSKYKKTDYDNLNNFLSETFVKKNVEANNVFSVTERQTK